MKQDFKLITKLWRSLLVFLCLLATTTAWGYDTYYAKGDNTSFFPAQWSNDDSQKMTTTDGVNYTWTSGEVTLQANTTITYKAHNTTKDTWHPSGANATITATEAGTYVLTITYKVGDDNPVATLSPVINSFYLMDNHSGAWNINTGTAFTVNGTMANLTGVELTYGDYFFFSTARAASADNWNSIAPYRYGPSSGTTTMTSGETYTAATNNGNSYQPAKSGTWAFDYNLGNHQWTGTLTAAPAGAKWYLVTSYGANNFTWNDPVEMAQSGNTFTVTKAMTAGDYFIFAQQVGTSWNNGTIRYTCNSGDETIAAGTTYSATRHGNNAYRVPTSGTWTFTYNYLTDQWSATYSAIDTNTGEMYLIGQANGNPWQANMGLKMTASGSVFTLRNVQIIAGAEFAFATKLGTNEADWSGLNLYRYTSAATDGAWLVTNDMTNKDNPQTLNLLSHNGADKNFKMEHTGRYNITVNWSDPAHPTVTIVRQGEVYPSLYMLGGPKSWAGNDGTEFYTTDGLTYTANMTLEHNTYFQFVTQMGTSHDNYPGNDYRFGPAQNDTEISDDNLNQSLSLTKNTNSFKMTIDGIFKVTVIAERNDGGLTPKTVTLQKIASVGNETIIHLEKTGNVSNPVLHAYNKERYNQTYGGNSIHIDRPSKDDLINTREALTVHELNDTTTGDGRLWWSWKVENAIADFYFTRDENVTDSEIQWRRAGELFFTWSDDGSELNDYTRDYYAAAAQEIADCATMLEGHYYVYFTNTPGWNQVFCHAWYTDNNNPPANHDMLTPPHKPETVDNNGAMYPGALCTLVGYDKDGYEVWRYDFGLLSEMEHLPTGVIFNNGIQSVKLKDEQGEDIRVLYDFSTGLETTMGKYQTGDFVAKNGGNYDYCGMISLGRSLGNIIRNGIVDGPPYTIEDDIEAIWLDENAVTELEDGTVYGALYCKDQNNFVSTSYVEKSLQQEGETDYVIGTTNLMGSKTRYDQSNWVKLTLSRVNTEFAGMDKNAQIAYLRTLVGNVLKAETVTGQLVNNKNPEMRITERPVTGRTSTYSADDNVNVFVTGSFVGSQVGGPEGHAEGRPYFFVTPKPQEYALITWAVYGGNDEFFVPTCHTYTNTNYFAWMNEPDLNGYFKVQWDLMQKPGWMEQGVNGNGQNTGQAYKFHAIIRLADESTTTGDSRRRAESQPYKPGAAQTKYVVSPIDISKEPGWVVTSVTDVQSSKAVKAVRYYNVAGMVSDTPFDGMNIIVTEYNDGTQQTSKAVY